MRARLLPDTLISRRGTGSERWVGVGEAARRLGGMSRLERIVSDPAICHGQPVIRGLRYPVELILELLASGMSHDEILADYADLERDDLLAALEYGLAAGVRRVVPLGTA